MPLPANTALPQKKVYPPIPTDIYQCELTDISLDESTYSGEKETVFKFELTLIEDGPHYGRKVWKRTAFIAPVPGKNGKNPWVWKICSALVGHALTKEEGQKLTAEAMNQLIGNQLRVNIIESEPKDGVVYNNVDSVLAAKMQLPPFDEQKVPKEAAPAAAPAHAPAPAPVPQTDEHPMEVETGTVNPDDIPF